MKSSRRTDFKLNVHMPGSGRIGRRRNKLDDWQCTLSNRSWAIGIEIRMNSQKFSITGRQAISFPTVRHDVGIIVEIVMQAESVA